MNTQGYFQAVNAPRSENGGVESLSVLHAVGEAFTVSEGIVKRVEGIVRRRA